MGAFLIIIAIIILVFVIRAVGNSNSDTSSKKSEWMDGRSNEKIIEDIESGVEELAALIEEEEKLKKINKKKIDTIKKNGVALVFDVETTGLIKDREIKPTKDNVKFYDYNFPRIVQIAFGLIQPSGDIEIKSYIIKQTEPIPLESIAIHGITDDRCAAEGQELKGVIEEMAEVSKEAQLVVGHNVGFDINVLRAECYRLNIPFPYKKLVRRDTMGMAARRIGGNVYAKYVKLGVAAEKLIGTNSQYKKIKQEGKLHDAKTDATITSLLFLAMR
jgi:DNA polymerase III epsilon subunit-like protein